MRLSRSSYLLALPFCLLLKPSPASASHLKALNPKSVGLLNKTAAPAASGDQEYILCSGETLHVGQSILGVLSSWTSTVTSSNTTGNTPSGTGDINDLLTNTGSLVDTVTYTVSILGVLGNSIIKAIVFPEIKATLSLEDDSNAATICTGDTPGFKITVVGVGPWEAEWTNGTTTKKETFSSNEYVFQDSPSGNAVTYQLNYIKSTNPTKQCDGQVDGNVVITIRPINGDPVISGPSPVCQGEAREQYTISDPVPADAYLWDIPGTLSENHGNIRTTSADISLNILDSATTSNIAVTGIYTCFSGERMGKTEKPFKVSVTPSKTAPGNISGPPTVCPGSDGQVYKTKVMNSVDAYEWDVPSGIATASGKIRTTDPQITLDILVTATSGDLTVRGIFTCSGSETPSPESTPFTINVASPLAKPNVVSGPDAVCLGSTNVKFHLQQAVTGAGKYLWTLPQGVSASSGAQEQEIETATNTINLDFDAESFVGGNITVSVINQCGIQSENSEPLTVSAKRVPDIPEKISGDSVLCADNGEVKYKINAVRGATSYLWDLPSFLTPAFDTNETKTNEIAVKIANEPGLGGITISAKNECGTGPTSPAFNVRVSALPNLNFALDNSGIYIGQVVDLTASADQDITAYHWDFGDGTQTDGPQVSHIYRKGGSFSIMLTGINEFQCSGTYSSDVDVDGQLPIIIQNVITQNGDQINDGLYIQGIEKFPNNEVTLLNRLGSKVAQIEHFSNNWNESYGNKKLQPGNYLCVVKIDGIEQSVKQTISVLDNQ